MPRRDLTLVLVPCVLALCLQCAVGFQVYLRELTIYKTHEDNIFDKKPEVYLKCEGASNGKVDLPNVRKVDEKYEFGREDVAATHVGKGDCRSCKLMEEDSFSSDEKFGDLEICQEKFLPEGRLLISVENQFDAIFECLACLPPPPSPPPPSPAPAKVVYLKSSTTPAESESRHTKIWQSPLFICLLIGLMVFGLIFGGVSYRCYLIVRANAEEERMREVEAILSDPEVDFEEMVENDNKAFNLNFWKHIQLRPKTWTKVGTKENADEEV